MTNSFIGGIGGIFAGLCCAGLPLFLAFLTGIGLGFVISDFILFPIFFISLAFMFRALIYNKRKHLSLSPIIISIFGAVLILIGIFVSSILLWIGVTGLFISTIWDYNLVRKCKTC